LKKLIFLRLYKDYRHFLKWNYMIFFTYFSIYFIYKNVTVKLLKDQ